MNLFKEATKHNWTFQSTKGVLNVQQLWQLTPAQLNDIAMELHSQFKQSKKESFLDTTEPDTLAELQLNLVVDIIKTKQDDKLSVQSAQANKSHNNMIDDLIEKKKNAQLAEMSIKDLQAMKK